MDGPAPALGRPHAPAIAVNYWEGAVTLSTDGAGYLELTGYGKRFSLLQ
ncbi:MAG: lipocalin family protein [Terriglobales bacterium]